MKNGFPNQLGGLLRRVLIQLLTDQQANQLGPRGFPGTLQRAGANSDVICFLLVRPLTRHTLTTRWGTHTTTPHTNAHIAIMAQRSRCLLSGRSP